MSLSSPREVFFQHTRTEGTCCKCLPDDWDRAGFYQKMMDYIEAIPYEERTADLEYERRLRICKSCGCLVNGMCTVCGCFAEVRAAKKWQRCAKKEGLW